MKLRGQTKWGWGHALYLFLGGLGGATFVMAVVADFASRGAPELQAAWLTLAKIGMIVGIVCLGIGLLILLLDLGKPLNAIHSFKRPGTSWIARGVIIIGIFGVLAVILIAFWIWPWQAFENSPAAKRVFEILALIFGIGVASYTGFLLSASRPITFWSTPLLPAIFLVSALYGGTLLLQLLGALFVKGAAVQLEWLGNVAIVLNVMLWFAFWFLLLGSHSVEGSRASTMLLLSGAVAGLFWFGVIVIGLLVPLVLQVVAIYLVASAPAGLYVVAAICGILGILFMRQAILAAGIHAPLRANVFNYPVPDM